MVHCTLWCITVVRAHCGARTMWCMHPVVHGILWCMHTDARTDTLWCMHTLYRSLALIYRPLTLI